VGQSSHSSYPNARLNDLFLFFFFFFFSVANTSAEEEFESTRVAFNLVESVVVLVVLVLVF